MDSLRLTQLAAAGSIGLNLVLLQRTDLSKVFPDWTPWLAAVVAAYAIIRYYNKPGYAATLEDAKRAARDYWEGNYGVGVGRAAQTYRNLQVKCLGEYFFVEGIIDGQPRVVQFQSAEGRLWPKGDMSGYLESVVPGIEKSELMQAALKSNRFHESIGKAVAKDIGLDADEDKQNEL